MENSNSDIGPNAKLQIAFPKSTEDHRLQLVTINGSVFAILHSPLESLGPIRLCCEEWSLILLAPIKSKTDILISAINVICLNEIASEEGNLNIHASNRLVKFGSIAKPTEKVSEIGERGEFQLDNDPGALLYFYRLFAGIATSARNGSPESFSEAQQNFIMSLCTLADKIEGNSKSMNIEKVLGIWDIPYLKGEGFIP